MHRAKSLDEVLRQAADAIVRGRCVIAVTGAGISAESGIPTFRGTSSLWKKYPPEKFATLDGYIRNPGMVWRFWRELAETVRACKPNPAHVALAELEALGHMRAIITQNIDNLHQEAGSREVIEYHGNAHRLSCLNCRHTEPLDAEKMPSSPPHCYCGGIMKPDVVMFGELIPEQAVADSERLARTCDVVLVVGTSAQVFPAAQIPIDAKRHGAVIIESNIEETDFTTHGITDHFIEGPAGKTLPKLLEAVRQIGSLETPQ